MINELPIYLYGLTFLVSILYASIGHGGASAYLALMGLLGVSLLSAKPIALLLNCMVSLIAFSQFFHSGYFNKKIFFYLVISSIPFAFFGGLLEIDNQIYKKILGVILLLGALNFFLPTNENIVEQKKYNVFILIIMGSIIGFIAGLIGIGGGILLTPLLLMLRYVKIKEAAGISAIFIFVNSLSGLSALIYKGINLNQPFFLLLAIALVGGFIGSYFGARKWNSIFLKKILSVVLIIASLKLIFL